MITDRYQFLLLATALFLYIGAGFSTAIAIHGLFLGPIGMIVGAFNALAAVAQAVEIKRLVEADKRGFIHIW